MTTTTDGQAARVALVTGGASGIGLATARRLLEAGHTVAILDASTKVGDVLADHPERARLRPRQVDLLSDQDLAAAAESVLEEFGRVDILVNNAGIHPKKDGGKFPVEEIPRSAWDDVFQVNLNAAFELCRAMLPGMKAAGWGRVVNVASAGAMGRPVVSSAHYVASKAALMGLTRCVAEEGARFGITANSIAPGPVQTGMTASSSPETVARLTQTVPLGRYGTPEEVAAVIAFLCSRDAAFVTGTVVSVDGGSLMR